MSILAQETSVITLFKRVETKINPNDGLLWWAIICRCGMQIRSVPLIAIGPDEGVSWQVAPEFRTSGNTYITGSN